MCGDILTPACPPETIREYLLSRFSPTLVVRSLENIINKKNLNPDDLKITNDLLKDLKDALGGN